MSIHIVTDSACDVPPAIVDRYGIKVVPVYVNIGEESYLEGVELSRRDFFENLHSYPVHPTTAAPAPGAFTQMYQQCVTEGATQILSMHIASKLSNTYNVARLGAEDVVGATVTLFDTEQITMGGGLLILLAAEAAAAGQSVAEIVALLQTAVSRTYVYAMLDTLESLRRSGRVNWAQFGFGTLLQIKPVMEVHASEIEVVARVRTRKRALKHMIQMVHDLAPLEKLAILHANAPTVATQLAEQAKPLFPPDTEVLTMEITPAIGTHTGPGAVGFACITKNKE